MMGHTAAQRPRKGVTPKELSTYVTGVTDTHSYRRRQEEDRSPSGPRASSGLWSQTQGLTSPELLHPHQGFLG